MGKDSTATTDGFAIMLRTEVASRLGWHWRKQEGRKLRFYVHVDLPRHYSLLRKCGNFDGLDNILRGIHAILFLFYIWCKETLLKFVGEESVKDFHLRLPVHWNLFDTVYSPCSTTCPPDSCGLGLIAGAYQFWSSFLADISFWLLPAPQFPQHLIPEYILR